MQIYVNDFHFSCRFDGKLEDVLNPKKQYIFSRIRLYLASLESSHEGMGIEFSLVELLLRVLHLASLYGKVLLMIT